MRRSEEFLYKWLPIVCGCHCRADRSFFHKGKKFPVCARCTGELIGIAAGIACCFIGTLPAWLLALLLIPLIVDGTVQSLTGYESTNFRRLISGILFGFGLFGLFALSVKVVYALGWQLGMKING